MTGLKHTQQQCFIEHALECFSLNVNVVCLASLYFQPGKDSKLVPILLVARVIFVPLFMLCNVQPRYNLPIFFEHDAWFIVFMIVFAFSNGYLASLCMCFGPK